MRTNRMAGLAATVGPAVAGGALVLGMAGPAAGDGAGGGHPGGRTAASAPALTDVDPSTLHLLGELGQLTAATARTVEQVRQAVADGGRQNPRTLPDVRAHLDAVGAAAGTKGTVKSMKARETTALAQAVGSLREELARLVRAGRAGDRAAVAERSPVTVTALVRVLSATAASGLVPAGQVPQTPPNAAVPPKLPARSGA
ncbi:hypothetical protein [Streptomyces sp. B22F1]|uniref:hypothetical protein n=1 Tax=Streptomyces sp. B22F1 TaxID=3153566 RepID=UPI00325E700A